MAESASSEQNLQYPFHTRNLEGPECIQAKDIVIIKCILIEEFMKVPLKYRCPLMRYVVKGRDHCTHQNGICTDMETFRQIH